MGVNFADTGRWDHIGAMFHILMHPSGRPSPLSKIEGADVPHLLLAVRQPFCILVVVDATNKIRNCH